jgi:hypothetical protein
MGVSGGTGAFSWVLHTTFVTTIKPILHILNANWQTEVFL